MIDPLLYAGLHEGHAAIEAPATQAGQWHFRDEAVLGTRMNLIVRAENGELAVGAARAARAEIDRLNLMFNSRLAESELSALNLADVWQASPHLFEVIAKAEQWRVATGGAFSARLGHVIDLWAGAADTPPDAAETARLAQAAADADVVLDHATRTIVRPRAVRFALDGLAKGWIVDQALKAMLAAPGVTAGLVDIGGDIACGGEPPEGGWVVGIPDPLLPFDNAPLVAEVAMRGGAIATSGRGPRDRMIGGRAFSSTLSPFDGWPVTHGAAASVTAWTAAEADALATVALVLPAQQALRLVERTLGTGLRLAALDGQATFAGTWQGREQQGQPKQKSQGSWHDGWQALATFTAPRRQLLRDPDFRSPYMAMWITDANNKPVRTLILIGKRAEWQRDNYIWWRQNSEATTKLMATRSMSTSGAGVYNVFWDGVDDRGRPVAPSTYILHVETSRERGQHTYRQLTLDFSQAKRFAKELAPTEEGGGLKVGFDHY